MATTQVSTLVSPGVSVAVYDQSFYATNGPGTVPFILLATRQNKINPSNLIAPGTAPGTAGKVYTITSQRELLDIYGSPVFPRSGQSATIVGSETAEYGLLAAHSVLEVTSRAYVMRADIDLGQLTATSSRPTGNVTAGSVWLDTSSTNWGIFEWNESSQTFYKQTPRVITDAAQVVSSVPLSSIGKVGEYAVVATNSANPVYYKNESGDWVLVGDTDWQNSYPTVHGTVYNATVTSSQSILINGTGAGHTVTISGTDAAAVASAINSKSLPGVTADAGTGYLEIYVTSASQSNGTTADGKISIQENGGTVLTNLGITPGTYGCPIVQASPHTQIPQWKSFDSAPRPTGAVWVKTTSVAGGANMNLYKWSDNTNSWTLTAAPLYANDQTAQRFLDPTRGGIGIALNTIYVQYDVNQDNTITYKLMYKGKTGPTTVTGTATNPAFTTASTFQITPSIPGNTSLPGATTITITGTTKEAFVTSLLSAGVPYIDATITATGKIEIIHTQGGVFYLKDGTNTPLATAGITSSNDYAMEQPDGSFSVSYFEPLTYTSAGVPPVAHPTSGTMWYYGTPIVADIMVSDGTYWKGYRELSQDARGYDLTMTDPNGPIISASKPVKQSDGITSLVEGDLWVSTADLENYPKIYRWQAVQTELQWVEINTADATSENGIVFADARWDMDGTMDPILDDLPAISDLLNSNYVDPDAPSPTSYPRGVLLFNTRRSSYNVKEFVVDHFNPTDYGGSLPDIRDAWVSISGNRTNGVPFFGRRAVRSVIVESLRSAIDLSEEIREDSRFFNLMSCPGYVELIQNMIALNNGRRETAFIIGDLPMGLSSDSTTLENYITNRAGEAVDSEYGLVNPNNFVGVYYPSAMLANNTDGVSVAVPSSHAVLRSFINSDNKSYPWFAPAGEQRGTIDNATDIGYVDRATGTFQRVGTRQGLRDLLYTNRVNPIALFSTSGLLIYGQKTRASAATALDRINVARLINYLRYQLEIVTKPLIFEPNDKLTRKEATNIVQSLLNDIMGKRGLYDYLVVCDETNNTPARIDRNELWIDVAIEPAKAVEFIYIPVRILNTGGIKAGNLTPLPTA